MVFQDRSEAGRRLAEALHAYRLEQSVVLALPRGGVAVAVEVSAALSAPLGIVIAHKIGVRDQPELAIGAVAEGVELAVVSNTHAMSMAGVTAAEFAAACERERREIERERQRYLGDRKPVAIEGQTAIVVDDGSATVAMVRAALLGVRTHKPSKVVFGVPVAPESALAALRREADDVVCVGIREEFGAVSLFYRDLRPVSDSDLVSLLTRYRPAAAWAR
jgi:predicted phosphoribosyltransferase